MRPSAVLVAALVAGAAAPASARVGFQIGGGANFPAGAANGPLTTGGAFTLGLSYEFSSMLGVTLDYLYGGNSIDRDVFGPGSDLDGLHAMNGWSLGARATFVRAGPVLAHVSLAPGLYYRRVTIDRVVGTAVGTYCDPWLLYCAPAAVPITETVGTRDQVDPGLSAGLGAAFETGPVKPYVEVRVHRIFGQSVQDAEGDERSTSATFIPLLLGIRY